MRFLPSPIHLRRLAAVLAIVAWAACVACTSDSAKRAIVTANALQEEAAKAYDEAKAQETAAGALCRAKAAEAGATVPALTPETWPAVRDGCAALGAPIPYDPFVLQKTAGPVNAAYESVRAANEVRKAVNAGAAQPGSLVVALMRALDDVLQAVDDLAVLGVRTDPAKAQAARELRAEVAK